MTKTKLGPIRLLDADDESDGKLSVSIKVVNNRMILLSAEGFGDCSSKDGHGCPVAIEYYRGRLRVIIWSDINEEDPTHVIDLEGARECNRRSNGR